MTTLVVDASVAVKWFAPEPFDREARAVCADERLIRAARSGGLGALVLPLVSFN